MAETFLAVRRGPGGFEQRVCIKRILPAFEQDEDFVRQFLHEARLSARLRHTHIVQVLDFGVHEGSHYLALELVEGLDLRKLFKALHRAQPCGAGQCLVNARPRALSAPSGRGDRGWRQQQLTWDPFCDVDGALGLHRAMRAVGECVCRLPLTRGSHSADHS